MQESLLTYLQMKMAASRLAARRTPETGRPGTRGW